MKKVALAILAGLLVGGIALAASFTDVDVAKHHGKTGLKSLTAAIDADFAMIESGTVSGNFDDLTINSTMTAISTNDASTNVLVNADAQLVLDGVTALASNKVVIGDGSGVGQAVTLSGDVTSAIDGTMALEAGVIVNADVNASAAIGYSKLALSGAFAIVTNSAFVDVTLVAPRWPGDTLIGSVSNLVYRSEDATTNGWILVTN